MENILSKYIYQNTIKDWFISIAIILGALLLNKVIRWIFINIIKKITSRTKSTIDDTLVSTGEKPILLLITVFIIRGSLTRLSFSPEAELWINRIYHILITMNITWLIVNLVDGLFKEYIIASTKEEGYLSKHLLPLLNKGIRIGIWTPGIILALNNAGYNVGTLIAGLGIGGLAMAMAAKDSLSNIFGGITILTDRPFKINDRIKISGHDGHVIDIGVRSTRLRTPEGRIVIIPNAKFTEMIVENVSLEPSRKITHSIFLSIHTSSDQLQQAIGLSKTVLNQCSELENEHEVGITDIYQGAFILTVVYYIKKSYPIADTQSMVILKLTEQLQKNHIPLDYSPYILKS